MAHDAGEDADRAADDAVDEAVDDVTVAAVGLTEQVDLRPSRAWLALIGPLALLSVVDVGWLGGRWEVRFQVTFVTLGLIAAVWLPAVLRRLVSQGGTLSAAGMTLTLERYRRMGAQRSPDGTETGSQDVAARLARLAGEYETVRGRVPSGFIRTAAQESILAEARVAAPGSRDELAARLARFSADDDGDRVVTLALLQGSPAPLPAQTGEVLQRSLGASRSSFEEYHVLRTVHDRFADLPPEDQQSLTRRVRRLLDGDHFPPGDRRRLARRICRPGSTPPPDVLSP